MKRLTQFIFGISRDLGIRPDAYQRVMAEKKQTTEQKAFEWRQKNPSELRQVNDIIATFKALVDHTESAQLWQDLIRKLNLIIDDQRVKNPYYSRLLGDFGNIHLSSYHASLRYPDDIGVAPYLAESLISAVYPESADITHDLYVIVANGRRPLLAAQSGRTAVIDAGPQRSHAGRFGRKPADPEPPQRVGQFDRKPEVPTAEAPPIKGTFVRGRTPTSGEPTPVPTPPANERQFFTRRPAVKPSVERTGLFGRRADDWAQLEESSRKKRPPTNPMYRSQPSDDNGDEN